jgi:glycosyltransferase involved in cell wall biosynthesis
MISIIIPTYNRAKYLPRAIESVLNQHYLDWELIISDDGSTDNTENIVQGYLKDNRIKYLKNKNAGATAARNSGARVSKGEYITFLDSDDEAKPNWLKFFIEEIKKGEDVICCGYDYIDQNGKLIKENFPINMGPLYGNRTGRFTNGGVFMMQKDLFLEIDGYDERVKSGQHSEMAIRLFDLLDKRNISISNIFKSLIKVHVHSDAKIRNDDSAIYEGIIYALNKHGKRFSHHRSLLINYYRVGAVSAFRIGKEKEAKELFYKAWRENPFEVKSFLQFILSQIPSFGRFFWKRR